MESVVVIPLESQIERWIFALGFCEFSCCFGEERDSWLPWFAGMIGKLKTGEYVFEAFRHGLIMVWNSRKLACLLPRKT